jgi:predicted homoserine dehydrogenase-like protein
MLRQMYSTDKENPMRIWLIGADQRGTEVLRQLQKNANIEVIVSDVRPQPKAVTDGVIPKVDYVEQVSSVNVNKLARRVRPDLILIDAGAEQRSIGRVTGGTTFSDALMGEVVAASEFPCLLL